MQDAFGTIIFIVVIVGMIVAVATALGMGRLYDQIGSGGLSLRDGTDRPLGEGTSAVAAQVRDEEIRQLLQARSNVRVKRGRKPLDIDAEMAAIKPPSVDAELLEEVRVLVEMRNRRRVRSGKEPLDVDAEIERQLRDLTR
jgi:hypothetical protein